ncbi:MAG: hypothetical protein QOG60_2798 [Frankiaceae bacterium]|nr:hypothetical protein [Frankiaceae bacterium]MDQ1671748.1 hypothetical protein [Frankiaceae bacterium]
MWHRLRLPRFSGRPFGLLRERLTTLVGAARDEPVRWPQVAKAAIATAIAWQLAQALPGKQPPVFAPVAAMLTIQVTAFESLRSAAQRTFGVIAGVLIAYGLAQLFGLHWWSIALVVFAAMALGQALALGTQGSTQVPVSALLVLSLGATTTSYAYSRVLETLLGAVVGVVVSLVLVPPLHLRDSGRAVRRLAEGQAELLGQIADDLSSGAWPSPVAGRRLTSARALTSDLARATEAVERVGDSVRLNPRARRARPAARHYRNELDALSHIQVQIRGIARTLADEAARAGEVDRLAAEAALTNSGPLLATTVAGGAAVAAAESGALQRRTPPGSSPLEPPPVELRNELVTVLRQVATALQQFGIAAVDDANRIGSPTAMHALAQQLPETRRAVREAIRAARSAELTPGTWLVIGSVLTDLRRILGELEGAREVPVDIPVHRPRRPPPRNPTLRSSFRIDRRRGRG